MFKNYLKITLRNILKYKAYSFINIIGLSIGITACILILLFVNDELSFDKFNINFDKIYRVHTNASLSGREIHIALSPISIGKNLIKDFPEVSAFTRLMPSRNMLIRYKNNVFVETNFFWADSGTFKVFTIPFLKGNPDKALSEPHTVVLTESLAKKYFGNEDPIDKIMNFEDGTPYTVSGVVKDCNQNSHWHYDMFASMNSLGFDSTEQWLGNNLYTYILLNKASSIDNLNSKLEDFTRKHVSKNIFEVFGVTYDQMKKTGNNYEFEFQPLSDIHLKSNLDYEIEPNSDIKYVYIFSMIAIFIMILACINFMNLATARASLRSREVGVRKVLGSSKYQLIFQFLLESILLTGFAVLLAVMLSELLLPLFNGITGRHLETAFFNNYKAIPALLLSILFIGFLAGGYPAFFLSSFKPVTVLGSKSSLFKNSWLRSGLVVFQFAISIILIIGTLVVFLQMKYIQNMNLGINKDHVLVIQRAWALENQSSTFKDELLKNSGIVSASNTDNMPGQLFGQNLYKTEGADTKQHIMATMATDYDFAKTLGIGISEGRYFSKEYPADTTAIIINETAVRLMNLDDPIGKRIIVVGNNNPNANTFRIVGVLKDFHYESLHQRIRPLIIFLNRGQTGFLPVRLTGNNISDNISIIKKLWKKFVPDKPIEYYFLNENFDELYRAEQKTGKIFTTFAVISILIACLGLFGLASFTAERRTKEIGIRKVMGATTSRIIFLISKDFIKWVMVANIIAWPIAYYVMNNWLADFAYRIVFPYWIFILSAVIAMIIAIITVSSQAYRAANSDPVKSLRYE